MAPAFEALTSKNARLPPEFRAAASAASSKHEAIPALLAPGNTARFKISISSPENSAAVAAEATSISNEQAAEIVKAATSAAPGQANKIAGAVAKVAPKSAVKVTRTAVTLIPTAADEIIENVVTAVPSSKQEIQKDATITRFTRSSASQGQNQGTIQSRQGTIKGVIPENPDGTPKLPTQITSVQPGSDPDRDNYGKPR